MAILQALLSLLGRSLGRILNAVFGWAVVALFGRTPPRQHLLLTMVVALAAFWPLLLAGIAFPRVAVFLLAFVPVFGEGATGPLRVVWIVLALAVPVTVGMVMAAKPGPDAPPESFVRRALRGIPVTLGIASAFLLMFLTVPVLRIISLLRGRKDEHVPLITDGAEYEQAAARIDRLLAVHGLGARRGRPAWWLAAPTRLLRALGGGAVRRHLPERLAYWRGPTLEVALYPGDLLIRGRKKRTALARGVIDEAFAFGPGLMTHDPAAQAIEREIRAIWRSQERRRGRAAQGDGPRLLARLDEVARAIARLEVEYEQWQVVYRKSLQLGRALRGDSQLLQATAVPPSRNEATGDDDMNDLRLLPRWNARPLADMPTPEVLRQAMRQTAELARKQVALAKAEARADLRRELAMVKGLGIAFACALAAGNLLLVAAVLALAATEVVAPWLAAVIVAGVVLLAGGLAGAIGWSKRVRAPLQRTRKTLVEDFRWLKQRMA